MEGKLILFAYAVAWFLLTCLLALYHAYLGGDSEDADKYKNRIFTAINTSLLTMILIALIVEK